MADFFSWEHFGPVLTGGALVFACQAGFEIYKDKRKRADEAGYLALQLAILIEGYAISCAKRVQDSVIVRDSDGHAGVRLTVIPKLPELPKSDSYRLIGSDLLQRILQYPQECQLAHDDAGEVLGDPEDTVYQMENNTIELGASACVLARNIRDRHDLPARRLEYKSYSIDDYFFKELEEIRKRRERVEAHQRKHEAAK